MGVSEPVTLDSVSLKDIDIMINSSYFLTTEGTDDSLSERSFLLDLPPLSKRGTKIARKLERWYDFHTIESGGILTKNIFLSKSLLQRFAGTWLAERIFTVIDKRAKASMSYREGFLQNLILYFTEAPEDKDFIRLHYELCFEVFDLDGDGIINFDDMYGVVSNISNCSDFSEVPCIDLKYKESISEREVLNRMRALGFSMQKTNTTISKDYFIQIGMHVKKTRITKGKKDSIVRRIMNKTSRFHFGEKFFFAWSYHAVFVASIIYSFGLQTFCEKRALRKRNYTV